MVVVMPLGHAIQSFWTGPARCCRTRCRGVAGAASTRAHGHDAGDGKGGLSPFGRDLLEDVMPMIERTYKVSKQADDRAIAGLSMGGGQTHQHLVQPAGAVSLRRDHEPGRGRTPATRSIRRSSRIRRLNKQFKLFWVGVGKDDTLTGPATRRSTRR